MSRVNYNQNNYSNITTFCTKFELFLLPYQITFFLAFCHGRFLFTYHFVTKKSLSNIPYSKTLQSKKITCFNKMSFKYDSTIDFIQKGYSKTLLHQRCSQSQKEHLLVDVLQSSYF